VHLKYRRELVGAKISRGKYVVGEDATPGKEQTTSKQFQRQLRVFI